MSVAMGRFQHSSTPFSSSSSPSITPLESPLSFFVFLFLGLAITIFTIIGTARKRLAELAEIKEQKKLREQLQQREEKRQAEIKAQRREVEHK